MTRECFRIAVMPGDGVGPEVTAEAVKCLRAVELATGAVPGLGALRP